MALISITVQPCRLLARSRGDVAQCPEVGPSRTPADDHVWVNSKNLLDIQVKVGKPSDVELEELASSLMARERSGKRIGLPRCLLVEPLDERLDIVRVPGSEDLADDLEILLSGHDEASSE